MYELKKKLERYLRVNLLAPGPRLMKKRIYRTAVSQRLRNTGPHEGFPRIPAGPSCCRLVDGCVVFFFYLFRCGRFGNTVFVGHWQHLEGQVHCLVFGGFSHCSTRWNNSVRMDSRRPFRPWIYVVAISVSSVTRLCEMSFFDCQAFLREAVATVRVLTSSWLLLGKCILWSRAVLRRSPATAWLLRSRVRIPPNAWICLSCVL